METLNETKLDAIVDKLNAIIEGQEEYFLSNEDNYIADWLGSFQYGEVPMDELWDNIKRAFEPDEYKLLELHLFNVLRDDEARFEFLGKYCELESCDIYRQHGEILSVTIGEQEVETDLDTETITSLSKEEVEYIRLNTNAYIDDSLDFMYIDLNYNRWVLILDIEASLEDIEEAA